MIRNLIFLLTAFTFLLPPATAQAEVKKTKRVHVTKPAKTATLAKSKVKTKVSSRKIIGTIQADRKYAMKTNYNPGVFQEPHVDGMPRLASSKALIVNQETGEVLYAKNTDQATPIASVTKLMTAMVMLDAHLPMDEALTINEGDVDMLKGTSSRLRLGTVLTRGELLHLALMASENRAASALGRNYPGGVTAFVNAMNAKAAMLGMSGSHFADPTGLNSANVSTAEDLVKMVRAAYQYPQIREASTLTSQEAIVNGVRNPVNFINTNVLVRNSDWVIGLSKTGFINEAGRCLVMQAEVGGQPTIIVLLDSYGKYSRIGDAQRIRKWIESSNTLKHLG